MCRSIVVKLNKIPGGRSGIQGGWKHRRPCLIRRKADTDPAEVVHIRRVAGRESAFASARKGTCHEKAIAAPNDGVPQRERLPGNTRGETLFVSVSIVFKNCKSYRRQDSK